MSKKDQIKKHAARYMEKEMTGRNVKPSEINSVIESSVKKGAGIVKMLSNWKGLLICLVVIGLPIFFIVDSINKATCTHTAFDESTIEYNYSSNVVKATCSNCDEEFRYKFEVEQEIFESSTCQEHGKAHFIVKCENSYFNTEYDGKLS